MRPQPPQAEYAQSSEPIASARYRKLQKTGDWGIAGEMVVPGVQPHEGMLCVVEKRSGQCDLVTVASIIWADGAGNFSATVAMRQKDIA
jgi:hypothetical protein